MTSKCQKCEKPLTYVSIEDIDAKSVTTAFKGLLFSCPHCRSVISVQVNPALVNKAMIAEVVKKTTDDVVKKVSLILDQKLRKL